MMSSKILRRGPECITQILDDLKTGLQEHGYRAVSQLKGSMSYQNCPNPAALERTNYMKALISYTGPLI